MIEGLIVPENFRRAFALFSEAGDAGNARAQYFVAVCYDEGIGVKPSRVQSLKYLKLAAKNGDEDAQFAMGDYSQTTKLEDGILKLRDLVGAFAWYSLAEKGGSIEAKPKLKRLKEEMTEGQIARAKEVAGDLMTGRKFQ